MSFYNNLVNILLLLLLVAVYIFVFKILLTEGWKWENGRQLNCKYKKLCLWSFRIKNLGFDAYILKYQPDARLQFHIDPVKGEHRRMNITLKGKSTFCIKTGEYGSTIYNSTKRRIISFRPDLQQHSLFVGKEGCTKLSFGFVKFM